MYTIATKTVDTWMAALAPSLRDLEMELRKLVLEAVPDLKESIKWGNPVYEKNGRVCYLAATEAYVSLGFFYGAALTDPGERIEGTGVKMRHIKVRTLADIHADQFAG